MNCPHPAGVLTSLLAHDFRLGGQNFSGSDRIDGGAVGSHLRIFSTSIVQSGSTAGAFRLHPAEAKSAVIKSRAARAGFMAAHGSRMRGHG